MSEKSPVTISGLDHLVMTVSDLQETIKFYTGFLGMTVGSFNDGTRRTLHFGSQKINLHELDGRPELVARDWRPGTEDLCFLTDVPISEVIRHAEALGIEIIAGPGERAGAEGPIWSIYVRDPDGNLIEVSNRM